MSWTFFAGGDRCGRRRKESGASQKLSFCHLEFERVALNEEGGGHKLHQKFGAWGVAGLSIIKCEVLQTTTVTRQERPSLTLIFTHHRYSQKVPAAPG
jgi:hypothetical protein